MRNIILAITFLACIALAAAVSVHYARNSQQPVAQAPSASDESPNEATSPHWQVVEKWLQSAAPRNRSALRMQVIQPGIILPPDAETYPRAPDNLSIVVTRKGNAPAQIEVRQGERSWNLTEEELDRLPAGIRLHVQRPLGWVLDGPAAQAALSELITPTAEASAVTPDNALDRLEKRLDEMNTRVETLLKTMQQTTP